VSPRHSLRIIDGKYLWKYGFNALKNEKKKNEILDLFWNA